MKKLLGLLAAFGMVATTSATVVACGDKDKNETVLELAKGVTNATLTQKLIDGKLAKVEGDKVVLSEEGIPEQIKDHSVVELGMVGITEKDFLIETEKDFLYNVLATIKNGETSLKMTVNKFKLNDKEITDKGTVGVYTLNLTLKETPAPVEKEELSSKIDAAKLTLNEVKDDAEATTKVKEIIAEAKLTDDVTIADPKDGKIVVTAKEVSKTVKGSVEFTYSLKTNEQ